MTQRATPVQRALSRARRALLALHDCFRGEDLSIRAAALTYLSAFSLVPLVTVVLTLLAGLHQQAFHDRVHRFFQDLFSPAMQKESAAFLDRFLAAASSRAVRGIGLLTLAYSAGSLLHHLEAALNAVWDVRLKRPLMMRIGLYIAALVVGPLLLALSLAGTASLRHVLLDFDAASADALVKMVSVSSAALALTLLYILGPNARVDRRAALAGGLVATLGWELAKRGYAEFGTRIFKYNAIYGSLGAIPLFLLWIYLSWVLVLFGARFAFALQRAAGYETVRWFDHHPMGDGLLALVVALELAKAEREGQVSLPRSELLRRIELPDLLCSRGIDRLVGAGLACGKDRIGLTRGLDSIVATDLFRSEAAPPPPPGLPRPILVVAGRLEQAARNRLDGLTLRSFVDGQFAAPTDEQKASNAKSVGFSGG